jgi:hypothetical protein
MLGIYYLADLYQTRGGAFFIVEEITVDEGMIITKFRFSKCSEEAARHWITTGEVEVFLNPFEDKVTEDETEGTVYVRMPANLKRRIEVLACPSSEFLGQGTA